MFEPFGGILHFQTPYQGNKLITIRVVNHRIHRENFKEKYITIKPNKYIYIYRYILMITIRISEPHHPIYDMYGEGSW